MTRSGWHPDPTGRFPKRWHDGDDWTASVILDTGEQGFDRLTSVDAPAIPGQPPPPVPAPPVPPPPAYDSPPPPPPPAATPQAAAVPVAAPDDASRQTWQPAPIPALDPTRPLDPARPAAGTASRVLSVVTVLLVAAGVVLLALSLFVLDWVQSASFADVRDAVSSLAAVGVVDEIVQVNYQWLAYAWAAVTVVSTGLLVVARVAGHRLGHTVAAVVAALGALLSTLAIVRLFRGPTDPELGAWALPLGYLVILGAVVVGARRGPA